MVPQESKEILFEIRSTVQLLQQSHEALKEEIIEIKNEIKTLQHKLQVIETDLSNYKAVGKVQRIVGALLLALLTLRLGDLPKLWQSLLGGLTDVPFR